MEETKDKWRQIEEELRVAVVTRELKRGRSKKNLW